MALKVAVLNHGGNVGRDWQRLPRTAKPNQAHDDQDLRSVFRKM